MTPASGNPFSPNFGRPPRVVAGRDALIDSFRFALLEGGGNPWRTVLISGTRGLGKTVLLNEFEDVAQKHGWIPLRAHATERMVDELIETTIPAAIETLDYAPPAQRRSLKGVTLGNLGGIESEIRSARPVPQPTLVTQLHQILDISAKRAAGVIITLDELQDAAAPQLKDLAIAIQDLHRDNMEIAFAAAGLPEGIEALLQQPGTTFLRRAQRIQLGPINNADARRFFHDTTSLGTKPITASAADCATQLSQGYPYLMQSLGSLSWALANADDTHTITQDHVAHAFPEAKKRLSDLVHSPALRDVPTSEYEFLLAMARIQVDDSPVAIRQIATELGKTTSGVSMARRELLYRTLIHAPARGYLQFTLPYLGDFLRSLE